MAGVALDANVLIYVLDNASPFSEAARKLLEKLEAQEVPAYMASVARTEILHLPYTISEATGRHAQRLLDAFTFITFVDTTSEIADLAASLCAQTGPKLKNMDALHLATAIHSDVTEFWTNDLALAKISLPQVTIRTL